ncbi:NB-ARC domain-containing protein [Planktothrix sp. FACHB-1365]|uniref:NB-ARC domain-containing protein n=1 Tax=Planktothrix sp. FACHB-1365 TaxID=2692855 RepID=UPI001F54E556|nr:NB-ARC domain-containing protein [Planktothrix sp. FACHB-1365]
MLTWVDQVVFEKTGKHLSSVQEAILMGVWDSQKYNDIANQYNCTEPHVRKTASELWQVISEEVGEVVNKSNLRSTLGRIQLNNSSHSYFCNDVKIGKISFCGDSTKPPEAKQNAPPTATENQQYSIIKPQIDLRDAPELKTFYDRTSELNTLKQLILEKQCRTIGILGIRGMGKSAIARHLIELIKTEFDYIIWRSLRSFSCLEITLKELIQFLSNQTKLNFPDDLDGQLATLLGYLRDRRCLIILDDVQCLFKEGQLAGHYKPEYQNYSKLFKLIGELTHNSCLLFNSWEPPLEVVTLSGENSLTQLFSLTGLGEKATELLRNQGLQDEENYPELIYLFRGNPLYLKLVNYLIQQLFGGKLSQYISYQPVCLGDELSQILQQQYQRLSELEKQAITFLSSHPQPLLLSQLLEQFSEAQNQLFKVLLSLERRGLIEKHNLDNEIVFTVDSVMQNYILSGGD